MKEAGGHSSPHPQLLRPGVVSACRGEGGDGYCMGGKTGFNASPLEKQSLNLSIRRHLWIVFLEIIVEFDNALQLYKVSAILDAV